MLRASIFQINQAVHPLPKEKSKSSELRRFSVYGIRVPTRPPRGKACTASTCLSTAAMPQASSPSNGLPFTRQLHDRMKKQDLSVCEGCGVVENTFPVLSSTDRRERLVRQLRRLDGRQLGPHKLLGLWPCPTTTIGDLRGNCAMFRRE